MRKLSFLLSLIVVMPCCLLAQQGKLDSLREVIVSSRSDTAVIDAQIELGAMYRKKNQVDSAGFYIENALEASRSRNYIRGEARAQYQTGVLAAMGGQYVEAMRGFDAASVLADSVGDKKTQASALQGVGNQKAFLGDYKGALDYCIQSIEIKRALGDSAILSSAYSSLGNLYNLSGQHRQALDMYSAALRLDTVYGNAESVGTTYYNIANTYQLLDDDSMALMVIENCLAVNGQAESENLGYALGMKGIILSNQGKYSEALASGLHSLALAQKFKDDRLISSQYVAVGNSANGLKNYAMAELYFDSSLVLSTEKGMTDRIMEAYKSLSDLYEQTGNTEKALYNLKRYLEVSDSLKRDSQKDEMLRMEMNYKFEKQKELDKAEQDKNNAIYEEDKKRKWIIIYSGAAFLLLALFFLVFVFNRYRTSQRQKMLIASQKEEVELQNLEIESKNKDITDSINYASRIQSAILPSVDQFRTHFRNSFVHYRPKDIVSGDFYWVAETETHVFYATADCTGHGVPGGFMSMLGMALLNEVVIERKLTEPGRILDMMRDRIISSLKQKGISGENKDGMDMVLCRIDRKQTELCFAAANNSLWLFRNGEILEYKADKQPVGIGAVENKSFNQQTIELNSGDVIYTFTDGYADQFGGPKNKKYKYSQLKQYLIAISSDEMQEQDAKLHREFITWKGIAEQVDDVLLIGIRV